MKLDVKSKTIWIHYTELPDAYAIRLRDVYGYSIQLSTVPVKVKTSWPGVNSQEFAIRIQQLSQDLAQLFESHLDFLEAEQIDYDRKYEVFLHQETIHSIMRIVTDTALLRAKNPDTI